MRGRTIRTLALLLTFGLGLGLVVPGLVPARVEARATRHSSATGSSATGKTTAGRTATGKTTAGKTTTRTAPTRTATPKAATKTTLKKRGKPAPSAPGRAALRGTTKVTTRNEAAGKTLRQGRAGTRTGQAVRPLSRGERVNTKRQALTSRGRSGRGGAGRAAVEGSSRYAPRFFDPERPQTLRAQAAVVVDTRTMKVVWAKNPHDRRPIASLTKLMTALVVLDHKVDLGDSMTVTMDDVNGAGHSHVRAGNRVAIGDLLRCSLISSDNCATRVLARSTGLSMPEFVAAMNTKARELNLRETHYADPTGLDENNISTASDQARLIILAADNPLISRITSSPSYTFLCGRRIESLTNTNRLMRSRSDIVGSKTGFINEAGYCLAMLIGDRDNPYLTTVVLGAPSNASRFAESSKLIEWALGVVGPAPAMASPNPSGTAPAQLNQPNRR